MKDDPDRWARYRSKIGEADTDAARKAVRFASVGGRGVAYLGAFGASAVATAVSVWILVGPRTSSSVVRALIYVEFAPYVIAGALIAIAWPKRLLGSLLASIPGSFVGGLALVKAGIGCEPGRSGCAAAAILVSGSLLYGWLFFGVGGLAAAGLRRRAGAGTARPPER